MLCFALLCFSPIFQISSIIDEYTAQWNELASAIARQYNFETEDKKLEIKDIDSHSNSNSNLDSNTQNFSVKEIARIRHEKLKKEDDLKRKKQNFILSSLEPNEKDDESSEEDSSEEDSFDENQIGNFD